jgi:hypothetical protein
VKRLFSVALGILTAIGGFVDIGDIVANTETGARFGMSLAWVVLVGVIGICLFAEMAGRVATVSGRAVFDLVRERLGARVALVNLAASFFITFLTLSAEIGGVALAIELATSVNYLLWVPIVAFLVWLVIWRVKFNVMENAFGLLGLTLVVAAVALWRLGRAAACRHPPGRPPGRGPPDLVVLRHRPARGGHDPLRGVLLLLGGGRGGLGPGRPDHQPPQRLHRLPPWRAAVPGPDGRGDPVP